MWDGHAREDRERGRAEGRTWASVKRKAWRESRDPSEQASSVPVLSWRGLVVDMERKEEMLPLVLKVCAQQVAVSSGERGSALAFVGAGSLQQLEKCREASHQVLLANVLHGCQHLCLPVGGHAAGRGRGRKGRQAGPVMQMGGEMMTCSGMNTNRTHLFSRIS